jgi:hypothetical protein
MSETRVPFGNDASETAILLLAAADDLGQDAHVVRTTSERFFLVPEDVARGAGLYEEPESEDQDPSEPDEEPEGEQPAEDESVHTVNTEEPPHVEPPEEPPAPKKRGSRKSAPANQE